MADLARMARPWLFALRQPARISTSTIAPRYLGLGYTSRAISTTTPCHASKHRERASPKKTQRQQEKRMQAEAMTSILLPYTIVTPPLRRYPLAPTKLTQMLWLLAKNRATTLGSLLGVYFLSMGGKWLTWPRFRARKRACIPAAKALHAQMSEAVAAGDKDTLRRICAPELFQTLAGAVDVRPAGTRTEWELVRYDQRLTYPRLADFRISYQPLPAGGMRLLKQAVVSIASVQRVTRYDAAGAKVPGSERERTMTEHIVLQAEVEDKTFESAPWKIWGTLPEMSFETIRDDHAMYTESMGITTQRKG
ncbi:hypothetical protein F4678DRAFT_430823, partial [Xylaria arbuscula]